MGTSNSSAFSDKERKDGSGKRDIFFNGPGDGAAREAPPRTTNRRMKLNTQSTKTDRLRMLCGTILAVAGVVMLTVIGAFYNYSNTTVWLAGFALIIVGLLVAKSMQLIEFISDITH